MKRFISFAGILFAFTLMCSAQDAPLFDAENAYIIDTSELRGRMRDDVKLINESDEDFIGFEVYYYDDYRKDWSFYGRSFLKEFSDSDSVDSPMEDRISGIRYFAVVPEDGRVFKYRAEKADEDLCIYVMSLDGSYSKPDLSKAFIIDSEKINGRFRDDVKFINLTRDRGISFILYVSNTGRDGEWQKGGAVYLKDYNDSDSVDSPMEDILYKFRYFAVVSREGTEYKYDVQKYHNDLEIYVR